MRHWFARPLIALLVGGCCTERSLEEYVEQLHSTIGTNQITASHRPGTFYAITNLIWAFYVSGEKWPACMGDLEAFATQHHIPFTSKDYPGLHLAVDDSSGDLQV